VGKPRDATLRSLHDRYALRITRLGARYESTWIPDTLAGATRPAEQRRREAASLLERLPPRGTVVALHEGGRQLTSEQLAQRLARWASPSVTFLIGGPVGLHEDVLARASWLWSLTSLTLPHEWVRSLVAEQLYRALTLLRGLPYHK
jgi:23S rRNA (pseudouridine1915-N3)-methyltransferase